MLHETERFGPTRDSDLAGSGPRVVIAGHTHAAREIRMDGERVYLNTGTWTDLLRLPVDLPLLTPELLADAVAVAAVDDRLRQWIDDLLAGKLAPLRRLSYASVCAEHGPKLRWHQPDPCA